MSKPIPAAERNALFPYMVQRKNPETGRWLNVTSQPTKAAALSVKNSIDDRGHETRIIFKHTKNAPVRN